MNEVNFALFQLNIHFVHIWSGTMKKMQSSNPMHSFRSSWFRVEYSPLESSTDQIELRLSFELESLSLTPVASLWKRFTAMWCFLGRSGGKLELRMCSLDVFECVEPISTTRSAFATAPSNYRASTNLWPQAKVPNRPASQYCSVVLSYTSTNIV